MAGSTRETVGVPSGAEVVEEVRRSRRLVEKKGEGAMEDVEDALVEETEVEEGVEGVVDKLRRSRRLIEKRAKKRAKKRCEEADVVDVKQEVKSEVKDEVKDEVDGSWGDWWQEVTVGARIRADRVTEKDDIDMRRKVKEQQVVVQSMEAGRQVEIGQLVEVADVLEVVEVAERSMITAVCEVAEVVGMCEVIEIYEMAVVESGGKVVEVENKVNWGETEDEQDVVRVGHEEGTVEKTDLCKLSHNDCRILYAAYVGGKDGKDSRRGY